MFFTIATTRSEKRQVIDYWEEIRKESEKIKDYYDKVNEDKYHIKFYERVFRIIGCDDFTREFYEYMGVPLNEGESLP